MKSGIPAKKPNSGAPGVKMLITAASLAATLGGWAVISAKETRPTPEPAPDQAAVPALSIKLAPLPTLVPVTASQAQIVTVSNRRTASAPQPAVAAPQPVLVLRDVSAPAPSSGAPAPVANTGSSR